MASPASWSRIASMMRSRRVLDGDQQDVVVLSPRSDGCPRPMAAQVGWARVKLRAPVFISH
jgi:hypothetical protein